MEKMFCDNSFVKTPLSTKKILEKMFSNSTEAMRSIICRMQAGEDMSMLFPEVVKIIDTQDVELKRLTNIFLKKYTKEKPMRQLLCVNTFLKDLADKSKEMVKTALETVGWMGDEIVLKNYAGQLKRLADRRLEIQMGLVDALSRIPSSIEILEGFIFSDNQKLSRKALGSVAFSNRKKNSLVENKGSNLIEKKFIENDLEAVSYLLKISPVDNIDFLLRCLKKDHLPLFFYASQILLARDTSYRQFVYDASLPFACGSDERIFHILLFQESLLDFVSYENSSFLIFDRDPLYIKRQKVKMLYHRLDDISIQEIRRWAWDPALLETILGNGLKKNFVVHEIFTNTNNSSIIDILYAYYPFSPQYTHLVKAYLSQLKTANNIKKFLFLAGNICDELPLALKEIESSTNISTFDIFKFYLAFFRRKFIDIHQLMAIFGDLKKNPELREKAKTLIDLIHTHGPYSLLDFAENIINEQKEEIIQLDHKHESNADKSMHESINENNAHESINENNFDFHKLKIDSHENNANKNNAYESNPHQQPENDIMSYKPYKETPFSSFKKTGFEEWMKTPLSLSSGDVLVDTKYLKGTLVLLPDSICLEVDILSKPQSVSFGFDNSLETLLVNSEETYSLRSLKIELINKTLKLIISNCVFEIFVDPKRLISPHKCPPEDFEESFKCLNSYKIVEMLDLSTVFSLDQTSFCFEILGHVVYGKMFCNQVVLKGDKEILEIF
ncbi:AP-3 complex subunit beta [Nosema granulosis]|uniref:AP-3 complex subunit beta n=1 Tax=Nosema granulosis TaxID=83296 RepID=A0A9P6H1B4_9MICR|nr:AP-3 complex subunit beta [Nosema granulosis]